MAKGIYVGAEGVARKVKKAYVGVEGQTIVEEENLTKFTSNPIPTTWVDSEDYLSAIATDEYGEWSIVANSLYNNSRAYRASKAVDGNTTSYWRSKGLDNTGYEAILTLTLPERVKIKPTTISIIHENLGNADYHSVLEAYNGSEYVTLETLANTTPSSGGTGQITKTIELSGTDYFSQFRLTLYRCSGNSAYNSPIIYSFEITAGTLKKITQSYASKSFAHKVKKGYIGVAGIARPFFSAEQKLEYYGTATALSAAKTTLAATSIGDYALFGGGNTGSASAVVDTYTSALVKGTATDLSFARYQLAATSVGDYALFGGGRKSSTLSAVVDTYTKDLTKGTATSLSATRYLLSATSVGDYALFGGGRNNAGSPYLSTVDTYTSALVKGTAASLSEARYDLAATSVGDYALFGGGHYGGGANITGKVDAYTSALVKSTPTGLNTAKENLAATSVGDYALFGGGTGYGYSDVVTSYTSSLVRGTPTVLSVARYFLAATSVGDYALFGGGTGTDDESATVDVYTKDLVKDTAADLSAARYSLSATSVGDYALFGGGRYASSNSAVVDVYQVV